MPTKEEVQQWVRDAEAKIVSEKQRKEQDEEDEKLK